MIGAALGVTVYFGLQALAFYAMLTWLPDILESEAGVSPEETLMVGDSDVDVRTGRNAGAWVLGCSPCCRPRIRRWSRCSRRS